MVSYTNHNEMNEAEENNFVHSQPSLHLKMWSNVACVKIFVGVSLSELVIEATPLWAKKCLDQVCYSEHGYLVNLHFVVSDYLLYWCILVPVYAGAGIYCTSLS